MRRQFQRGVALLLGLLLALACCAMAEEPAAQEAVELIPLEPGMSGVEVEGLNAQLTMLGYLSGELSAEYGDETEEAVRAFQAAAGIKETGLADIATQEALFAEDAPVNPENPVEGERVWIPKSGKKYHSYWNCGNMQGPTCVSLDEAVEAGFEPCSRCYSEE